MFSLAVNIVLIGALSPIFSLISCNPNGVLKEFSICPSPYFDVDTGNDYPDGDEWFIAEFLFPYQMKLPDNLKGTDYFTTISVEDGKTFWHHRELIRYKYGKSKKLDESLDFIESKYKELHSLVEPLEKEIK